MLLNSDDIQKILPHRYPFLLVDRILEMTEDSVVAIKNVTANEMQFIGHFPQKHVMPGVLLIEALAQAGGVLVLSKDEYKGKLAFLAGVDKFKFRRQVIPGDTVTLKAKLIRMRSSFGIAECEALVDGEMCASGEIKFAIGSE